MKELIFATNNDHKLTEIRELLKPDFRIVGLKEKGIYEDIPEDFFTLEENAFQKAEFIYERFEISCFADDTGLEIEALNGEPGVFSARYSRMGEPVFPELEIAEANIRKVLAKLKGVEHREARFRTVIALIMEQERYSFEGIVKGRISTEKSGKDGFGYDPVFVPEGYDRSFAEMSLEEKNSISHRALAVKKLIDFLRAEKYKKDFR